MKHKEYLPPGISEAEFIEIVGQASNNPAYKFVFGFHDVVDLKQQAVMIAIGLMGYNVIIVKDGVMPDTGRHLVALGYVKEKLLVRVFDDDGNIVKDIDEYKIKEVDYTNKLKELIVHESFSWYIRKDILNIVSDLSKHKPANCKFKPRGEKPMHQQLANFFRAWLYNRLSNYRRDNCCKYPNNGGANQIKFNLMYPLQINSLGLANSEMFARESELPDSVSQSEIVGRLTGKMRKKIRSLYNRYLEGEELSFDEFHRLRRSIKRILPGKSEEYIDE